MCRCENVQICRFVNAQMLSISNLLPFQFIRTPAYQQICTLIKKALSYNTRRLLNIFQIRLVTFTSINRILNVVVMYDYFFE